MASAKPKGLLINLGRIGWNLPNRPIVLPIFWVIFFMCSTKFNLTSIVNPRCFWDILFFIRMLFDERQEWSNFIVFLLNITSYTCLVKSGLNAIFDWKSQLLITVRSLRKVAVVNLVSLTTEKRDLSSAKSLLFENFPFDKLLM